MNTPGNDQLARRRRFRLPLKVKLVSWLDLVQILVPVLLISAAAILIALHFVRPAPPHVLTISTGPAGSRFKTAADRYQKILARNHIQLNVLTSDGSLDNLRKLTDAESGVDLALVQGGVTSGADEGDLVSLGSVFYQPLTVFYRSPKPMQRLSELKGRRIAIGSEGSGTRFLALALLKENEIEPGGATTLLDLEGEEAQSALSNGQADAIFLSGDSASATTIRAMLHAQGVRLFDFPQADAYVRRFRYLSRLALPAGAFDLGANLPAQPINMLAPTVEIVAHSNLDPALIDLMIEAATEVHGPASLLQEAGEFPNPTMHNFPVSPEATRYYKSGRSFAYRYLPFWLASLFTRALLVLVPIFVVVIPALRFLPQLYNWRIRARIHRRYGELMALERQALLPMTPERREELLRRVDQIERAAIKVKIPGAFADQLYDLREDLQLVRESLMRPEREHELHEPPQHEPAPQEPGTAPPVTS